MLDNRYNREQERARESSEGIKEWRKNCVEAQASVYVIPSKSQSSVKGLVGEPTSL